MLRFFPRLFGGGTLGEPDLRPPIALEQLRYLHDSLTIFTAVIFKCPCSLFIPESLAASFVSSFKLCIVAFETTPVAVTV